jgi:ceramide glucosyltransferase
VVETFLPPYTLRDFFRHQLRWARSLRDSRRWGYLGMVLTFGLPWAMLVLAFIHGALWAHALAGLTIFMRLAVALVVGRGVVNDRQVPPWLILVPVRDLMAIIVWVVSFMGDTVAWRGTSFTLKDGKLARVIE